MVLKKIFEYFFPLYFYASNTPGPPRAEPFGTLRPCFEQPGEGPPDNATYPIKHLSQVVLKKQIFEYMYSSIISMVQIQHPTPLKWSQFGHSDLHLNILNKGSQLDIAIYKISII